MKLAGLTTAAILACSLGCLPTLPKQTEPMTAPDKSKPVADEAAKRATVPADPARADEINEVNAAEAANRLEAEMQAEMKGLEKK